MLLEVRILYTESCANTPQTVERAQHVAQELGIEIDVDLVKITTQDQADRFRFLGSPTVQVNGQDIDPAARLVDLFGFT